MSEKTIVQQRAELLLDTIQYYAYDTSRRSVVTLGVGKCSYTGEGGKACAIGRLYPPHHFTELWTIRYQFTLLSKEHRALGIRFLEELQVVHDESRHWQPGKGMTKAGMSFVSFVDEHYCGGLLGLA